MQVSSTNVQKWSATTATFPLAVAITGNATTAAGITATQSTSNTAAITATGNGTAAGITSTGGGTSGNGITGTGGVTDGNGVRGIGGETSGEGGYFTGAAGGYGVHAVGGSSGIAGAVIRNGIAATGGTRRDGLVLDNGDLSLDGVADATHTTAVKNRLTPSNITKSWGNLSGATPTANAAFNVSSVSCGTNRYTVNVAQDFATANYTVVVSSHNETVTCTAPTALRAADSFQIHCNAYDGSTINLCAGSYGVDFIAKGVQ
jgi:hypothetical protein